MPECDSVPLVVRDLLSLGRFEVAGDRTADREADRVLAWDVKRGGGQQYLARRRRQLGNPRFDERLHVGWHGQQVARRGYAYIVQEPADLERKEWVAAGRLVDAHEHRA